MDKLIGKNINEYNKSLVDVIELCEDEYLDVYQIDGKFYCTNQDCNIIIYQLDDDFYIL